MRLQNWLDDKYIGITSKSNEESEIPDNIKELLNKLNRYIPNTDKTHKFGLISEKEFNSPSDTIKMPKVKLNKIVQKWLLANEELENLKNYYKENL